MSWICPRSCQNKNEHGYCLTSWCINPLFSNFGTWQQGQGVQRRIITNADRIRSMTDEELADEILSWFNWLNAVEWDNNRIINWLKQEAKHEQEP